MKFFLAIISAVVIFSGLFFIRNFLVEKNYSFVFQNEISVPKYPPLDKRDYAARMFNLANIVYSTSTATTSNALWPAKAFGYPFDGAILPFRRIVAYYGNFYSKQMGILGQYPEEEVLSRLQNEIILWNAADPDTPALPAIHYIAVTAQGSAGEDGMYRLRMPSGQIEKAINMAKKIDAIVFLDIQAGLSSPETEVLLLEKYLKMPQVNLGIDPEFYMKIGGKPGKNIGTIDAEDINFIIGYLAKLVKENDLPPKILVVHRFTEEMITNYEQIKIVPEVQVVINMDGWGTPEQKKKTFQTCIYSEPVQFVGFKLFYKNDTQEAGTSLMTPEEILDLIPHPIYIQYQ